ncbi:MAG: ADP-ribosylglycohydrolase family protein [Theionarchaea archaeon]|nr:ADP-ribosylglycohydrolase family protein [Theionarchaea archaeon]
MISEYSDGELRSKFKLALLLSAVGDSLGWPQEFAWKKRSKPVKTFLEWKKLVGGKWWGYEDTINPGDYSDDTQLTLSVARSINTSGGFVPEYFAYLELPLWMNYERGGGRSIKTAARNILKRKSQWFSNFYRTNRVKYENAGANGAAMRNLPIALVNMNNERRFIIDTFKNSIITHGHPRAIIGSILIGGAQMYFLKHEKIELDSFRDYIYRLLQSSIKIARGDENIAIWLTHQNNNSVYERTYENTIKEAQYFMDHMEKYLPKEDEQYYRFTKALDRNFKGSGVSTAICAIYLALKYIETPENALFRAANMVGSDTDTIASFVGSLIGAFDNDVLSSRRVRHLIFSLQDKNYFKDIGKFLWEITFGSPDFIEEGTIDKTEAFLKIMAWEIGLHEMFWDALEEGNMVVHPTLGKGTIQNKTIKELRRDNYIAKIIKINFNMGQTAYFHSRVSTEGLVQESISEEIEKTLS